MTTVNPFSWFGLLKAMSATLFAFTLLWAAVSFLLFQDVLFSQLLAGAFLILAVGIGAFVYQRFQRLRLQYDERSFALFTGKNKVAGGQWKHFNQVSLFHRGYGMFAVRVYTPDKNYIDIPASELKMDWDAFRRDVSRRVMGKEAGERPPLENEDDAR
ncbi:MAG: hypothetical protein HY259_14435 [Chloroflexi bacterium]|nr:hypothetical protein [Chloroflexota bacterium]MBI3734632.1 hypothetical protein [Chloroflexota bacterium]